MTTLAFIGDVMLGRGVNDELRHVEPQSVWGTTLSVLRDTAAVIANLECAVTDHTTRWTHTRKVFHFRADPAAVEVLRKANVQCVSLANNHLLDFEEQGLLDTVTHLDAAGIAHAGAGKNLAGAQRPAVLRLPGLTLGMMSMTDNEPAFAATADLPGTNYVDIRSTPLETIGLDRAAASCREHGADLAILTLHWGPNMMTTPPKRFREFAHAAIEAGFDVVHGHSAHVFQGVELYRGRPILYDTGDFIDDYAVDERLRNDWSFIFLVDVPAKQIERVRLIPVCLAYARTDLAAGKEAEAICRLMIKRSAPFGTAFRADGGVLELMCRKPGGTRMSSDIDIQHDVIEQLEADPEIEASRIGVAAENGVVTLAGHVASLAEKEKAEERVRRVEGVRAVANDLKVVVAAQYCRDDAALAAAAVDILARHPLVPSERINISVSDGWMTITGDVDWVWQRREAEDALGSMIGLRGFTSSLVARPRQVAPA